MRRHLLIAVVLAVATVACKGPTDPSKNKTEMYSDTVQPGMVGPVHSFSVSNTGEFSVNFTAFAPGNVFIGVAWGQFVGGGCSPSSNNVVGNTNVGRTVLSGSVIIKGQYCVFAYDPAGTLGIQAWTVAQNYTLTVSHP